MYFYLFAYEQGLDIIEAEAFRKERKSHRSHNSSTDAELEARVQVLYSPETGIELEETIMNDGLIEEEMNEEDLEARRTLKRRTERTSLTLMTMSMRRKN